MYTRVRLHAAPAHTVLDRNSCACSQARLQANALEANAMMSESRTLSDLAVVAAREAGMTALIGGEESNVDHEEATAPTFDSKAASTTTAMESMKGSGGEAGAVAASASEARKPSANRAALEAAIRAAVGSAVGAAIRNSLDGAGGGGSIGATTADVTSNVDTIVSAEGAAETNACVDTSVKSNAADGGGAHEKTNGGVSAVVDSDSPATSSGDGLIPTAVSTEASSDAFVRAGVRVLLMLRAALLRAEAAAAGTPREGLADLIALSDMKVICAPNF